MLCPGSARVDEDLQCKNRWEPFPKSNYKTFNEEPCSLCQGCLCPACYKSLWARAAAACCSPDTAFLAGGCLNEGDVSMSPVGSARHCRESGGLRSCLLLKLLWKVSVWEQRALATLQCHCLKAQNFLVLSHAPTL